MIAHIIALAFVCAQLLPAAVDEKEAWAHFIGFEDAAFVEKLTDSLAPGGMIVVEQLNSGSEARGPANALFKTFSHLRVVHYEAIVDTAEWPNKPARVGRFVAQKD